MDFDKICALCKAAEENSDHLFCNCPITKAMLRRTSDRQGYKFEGTKARNKLLHKQEGTLEESMFREITIHTTSCWEREKEKNSSR
ncbi:unnamed protein product [Cuscuta campestris]|uniref:Reverse transcriptase zinc-binding domain-containing protein n=1 Tax=Cuscuta campestris TaxID=132261 RepID=A0A484M8E5_9ASTE|nr:unnamed protein product [Cuscuta campestris]